MQLGTRCWIVLIVAISTLFCAPKLMGKSGAAALIKFSDDKHFVYAANAMFCLFGSGNYFAFERAGENILTYSDCSIIYYFPLCLLINCQNCDIYYQISAKNLYRAVMTTTVLLCTLGHHSL
jgi:hypothetical protein